MVASPRIRQTIPKARKGEGRGHQGRYPRSSEPS